MRKPGDLPYRITIQAPPRPKAVNAFGEPVIAADDWTTLFRCWASAEQLATEEQNLADQAAPVERWKFTIVMREGITSDCRILWGSATMKLDGPPAFAFPFQELTAVQLNERTGEP